MDKTYAGLLLVKPKGDHIGFNQARCVHLNSNPMAGFDQSIIYSVCEHSAAELNLVYSLGESFGLFVSMIVYVFVRRDDSDVLAFVSSRCWL